MTMNKTLYLSDDIDRLYVLRKGGRGLTNIEDNMEASTQGLEDYIKNNKGLITSDSSSNSNIQGDQKKKKQNP